MRKLILTLSLCICAIAARAQTDSASLAKMDAMLDEYVAAIEQETVEAKGQECDFLISACTDSMLRQRTALKLYSHYITSRLMGDEGVAIGIYDRWIATGKVSMLSETDEMNASVYAEFNRRTLLGCEAPVLDIQDPDGRPVTIGGSGDRQRVLLFYDTDCPKCKLETIILKSYLEMCEAPLDLYAVYTGDDAASWEQYRREKLDIKSDSVRVFHAWDPDSESDMQRLYGVLETPRMYLIDAGGKVIGRRLTTEALQKIVAISEMERELFNRNQVGDRLPDMTLPGVLMTGDKSVERTMNLRRLKGSPAYLVLRSEGCDNCRREMDAMRKALEGTKIRVFVVDVDTYMADDMEKGRQLFDAFDLSTLPHIIKVDRKGIILERYISFQ